MQRIVEQHGVLRHHPQGLAQAVLGDIADIHAIDTNRAGADVVEAKQQPGDG